jgi:hypothetical protein
MSDKPIDIFQISGDVGSLEQIIVEQKSQRDVWRAGHATDQIRYELSRGMILFSSFSGNFTDKNFQMLLLFRRFFSC